MTEGKHDLLRFGAYEADGSGAGVTLNGTPIDLSWRCREALAALIRARNGVVTRDQLFALLWPGVTVEDSNLTKVVSELRRSLAADGSDTDYIETVPGLGYRLAAPVQPVSRAVAAAAERPPHHGRWIAAGAVGAVCALVLLSFGVLPDPDGPRKPNPDAEAAYSKGMELLNKQSWKPRQESIPHFREAVAIDPSHARAHAALGFALMGVRGKDASLAASKKAVELDPDCAPCQATLGYVLEVLQWDWAGSRTHLAAQSRWIRTTPGHAAGIRTASR